MTSERVVVLGLWGEVGTYLLRYEASGVWRTLG